LVRNVTWQLWGVGWRRKARPKEKFPEDSEDERGKGGKKFSPKIKDAKVRFESEKKGK